MAEADDRRVPYEILIRFDEEGKPKAAHLQYRRIVMLGGEVLKNEPETLAHPLSFGGAAIEELLGAATVAALGEVTRVNAEIEALTAALNRAADAIESANGRAAAAEQRVEEILTTAQAELAAAVDAPRRRRKAPAV